MKIITIAKQLLPLSLITYPLFISVLYAAEQPAPWEARPNISASGITTVSQNALTLEDDPNAQSLALEAETVSSSKSNTGEANQKNSLLKKLLPWKKKMAVTNERKTAKVSSQTTSSIETWYRNRQHRRPYSSSPSNLEKQASNGDINAQYKLGLLYRSGGAEHKQDGAKAMQWLSRAANAKHTAAQYALAQIYSENINQSQNKQQARYWFRQAAQRGHSDAQYSLGLLYGNDKSNPNYAQLAKKWFEKSAQQGNITAKIALADLTTGNNHQLVTLQTQALTHQPRSSSQHKTTTQYNKVAYTAKSLIPEKSYPKIQVVSMTTPAPKSKKTALDATKVNTNKMKLADIKQDARSGDRKSQLLLGTLYEDGKQGVQKDLAKAARWYRKAAKQGYAQAQYNLGLLYEDGKGMPQDYYEATRWYKQAAKKGLSEAQNNLGVLYILGKGVMQNKQRAEALFRQAVKQGNVNAKRNLKLLLRKTT
jgi:TPR repeat protein